MRRLLPAAFHHYPRLRFLIALYDGAVTIKIAYDNGEERFLPPEDTEDKYWKSDGYGNFMLLQYDPTGMFDSDFCLKEGVYPITIRLGYPNDEDTFPVCDASASFLLVVGNGKPASLSKASVTVKTNLAYTGKAQTPAVKVTLNGRTLEKGRDYSVSYKNNKAIGAGTVTVKGTGAYTGTKSKAFKIVPRVTKVSSLKALGSGKVKAAWKRDTTVTGYQVFLSYKPTSGFVWYTTKNNKTLTYTKAKLKKNKYCYVKMRSYKKVKGVNYFSPYTKTYKVKIK